MVHWDDGYVTDVPYVTGYHRETSPIWLTTAATLLGSAAPDLARPFRYADLGCGNGVTALVTAATTPHAEVWAFDFNPAHVEAGRDIARRAGLTNIRFEEASFDDIANRPPDALPMFDYIVAHGVVSWVSLENRRRLFTIIGQRLAPGGLLYLGYNVTTGWTAMRPVHTLMRLLAEARPERSDLAAASVFDTIEKMQKAGASMFHAHPTLGGRISEFRGYDPRYVAHELLNRDWHPVMFAEIASAMAAIKCEYVGNATLHDNIAALSVPGGMTEMFGQAHDVRLRETLRDLGAAVSFRRDLYQRGARRLSPTEHKRRTSEMDVVRTFRPVGETLMLDATLGQFAADISRYPALLEVLDAGPTSIGRLRGHPSLAFWPDLALLEAVALLISSGYVAPMAPLQPSTGARAATARLNQVHAALFEEGHERPFLAYPALCSAWEADGLEIEALDELLNGVAADAPVLADAVLRRLERTGRHLYQKGETVADPGVARDVMTSKMRDMVRDHLPAMRLLGVLSTEPLRESQSEPP